MDMHLWTRNDYLGVTSLPSTKYDRLRELERICHASDITKIQIICDDGVTIAASKCSPGQYLITEDGWGGPGVSNTAEEAALILAYWSA